MEKELGSILEELSISLSLIPSLIGSMFDPFCHDLGVMNNASIESIVVGFGLDDTKNQFEDFEGQTKTITEQMQNHNRKAKTKPTGNSRLPAYHPRYSRTQDLGMESKSVAKAGEGFANLNSKLHEWVDLNLGGNTSGWHLEWVVTWRGGLETK
ncbi:hypothetical protein M9H77_13156 [Catharanthus roseus]|uniref:Uncharacterized protein n=1 Tax=Catharanthus roseus TaxID=4058 RepID=A0ACC0BJL5_CATRO|nr:hypothetical protein M9H77_13156 [Catharanthus roseus]